LKISYEKSIFALLLAIILHGCATHTPTYYEVSYTKTFNLEDGPLLSTAIPQPVELLSNIVKDNSKPTRGRFESEEDFNQRLEIVDVEKSFVVTIPLELETGACRNTSYDFDSNTYNLRCDGFDAKNSLQSVLKDSKILKLQNAYTARDVEFIKTSDYRLAAGFPVIANLSLTAEEAKNVEGDLMAGLAFTVTPDSIKLIKNGYCFFSLPADLLDDICKETGFQTGMLVDETIWIVHPKTITDLVVFRKSNNKILYHEKYVHQ